MKKQSSFENKTVIVTGGASGIGRGLCELLAERGALVYATDVNQEGLQSLVAAQSNITPVVLNVSQQEDFQRAIGLVVSDHGHLDIIINNAGIALAGDFSQTSMAEIEKIVNINLWGVIYGTKLAYAQMITQGHGHIVNVSSSGGAMPVPKQTMYSAIKHAIIGLSHSLREEAAHHGVHVNTVLPGMVQSDLWDTAVNVKDYNMKKEMDNTGLKPISSRAAAEAILKGISANDRSIVFPRINRVILRLYRWFPGILTKLVIKPLAKTDPQ